MPSNETGTRETPMCLQIDDLYFFLCYDTSALQKAFQFPKHGTKPDQLRKNPCKAASPYTAVCLRVLSAALFVFLSASARARIVRIYLASRPSDCSGNLALMIQLLALLLR